MYLSEHVKVRGFGKDGKEHECYARFNDFAAEIVFEDYMNFQRYRVPAGGALIISLMGTAVGTYTADQRKGLTVVEE
jgi:hypothetical protein